ncbi:MAG: hypothetical protein NT178_05025 [Proteobacteria bacterium]|nr:hypothetical protein [Pseudomonadota bacterium]
METFFGVITGIGNVIFATIELAGSLITAVLAIMIPAICFILVVTFCTFVLHKAGYHFFGKMKKQP